MGIDPVTHKPISQVFSELGNISGLPNSGHLIVKSEPSSVITELIPSSNMIVSPRMEQVQDLNSFYNRTTHFQVTNTDIFNVQPHFFNEVTSSCSSSSSSHVTDLSSPQSSYSCQQSQPQTFVPSSSSPSSSLNWSEFFLRDTFESTEVTGQEQEDDLQGLLSSANPAKFANGTDQTSWSIMEFGSFGSTNIHSEDAMSNDQSKNASFVDTILDQDSELRATFPEFLDGSFEYY